MKNKDFSIAEEISHLKKLKDEGILSEREYEKAKEKALGFSETSERITEKQSPKKNGLKRDVNAYDIITPIILIICVFALKGGLIGGAILGALIGVVAFLVTKITKSIIGRILLLIFFAVILTFLGSLFSYSGNLNQKNDNTSEFNLDQHIQNALDKTSWATVYNAREKYYNCMGEGKHSYQFISDCVSSANLPVGKFNGTSCDGNLNTIIQAFIDANEHCSKAGFYEEGKYIKQGISIETYTNETTKCNAARDQFSTLSYKCGDADLADIFLDKTE